MNRSVLRLALLGDAAHINIQRWCEGLSRAGAEIYLLSFAACRSNGVESVPLPIPELPAKLHYFAAVPYVRRLIRSIQPHVLVAYYVAGYGTLAALAGYHPLVQVTSGSDVLTAPNNPIMKRLLRFSLSRADLVTAWAPHMARAAEQLGVSDERVLVLPRGIPFQKFFKNRCRLPQISDSITIISTRQLIDRYRIEQLLSAARLLREKEVPFSLTVAGDGPQRPKLIGTSQKLDLENQVRFTGFVPNDELPNLLAQHNLYISLIDSDGVSASLLEAMTVGLLPIVPNNPANRFWIESGENGLLLDDLSPLTIANAIQTGISDLSLRERAWEQNVEIVRSRGDAHHNSQLFVDRFRQLANRS
jgi:glycosyltransferase involved in cell wall biosynthesis